MHPSTRRCALQWVLIPLPPPPCHAARPVQYGEWSPPSAAFKLPSFPPPERVQIEEIPSSWVLTDVAGAA